nr:MAG TPA: hypothetical protein [Caudoviricetes sp.]
MCYTVSGEVFSLKIKAGTKAIPTLPNGGRNG